MKAIIDCLLDILTRPKVLAALRHFLIGFLIAAFLYGCHVLRLTAAPLGGKQREITLAWTPVSGYKTYKLVYGQAGTATPATIAITGATNYSLLLRSGTTYQFSLRTLNTTNGLLSPPDTITYSLPNHVGTNTAW